MSGAMRPEAGIAGREAHDRFFCALTQRRGPTGGPWVPPYWDVRFLDV